ncbi:hypothetical protein [Yoonia sp.]|uniref:hypothetical protein n=1 Tax=Yoonia sp. TaxID=2212373 RepID=UPI0019F65CD2|nr:hypothetical protein [Yoonia sp.]MBE0413786.1 hypothetical protein [Yoonia sp.]
MNDRKQLAELVELTAVQFRAIQSEMAALLQKEARLRRNLAQLIESRKVRAASGFPADDAAAVAWADLHWHQWVDQRRAIINGELAQVLSEKDTCKMKLTRAFGRDMATRALQNKVERTLLRTVTRSRDYVS